MENFQLHNGVFLPSVGLGTYPMKGFELIKTVQTALRNGYALFDTSHAYHNETALGIALKLSRKKRSQQFVSTKLSNRQQEYGDVRKALKGSMKRLGVKYLDLYLIHWPYTGKYKKSWKQIEDLYDEGLIRAVGVCNFHQRHLEELFDCARIKPMVNQVELHPLLSQRPLRTFCQENDVLMEAYSPLARMNPKLIDHPVLKMLAEKYGKTVVQIILRWNLQNKVTSIPKTANPDRLRSNVNIFDFLLSETDMEQIESLNEDFRVRYDPDNCDFTKL